MHFQSTTLFLAAAVIFQGVSAQFCTGPPSDCNFEDAEMPLFPAAPDRCTVQRADLMTIWHLHDLPFKAPRRNHLSVYRVNAIATVNQCTYQALIQPHEISPGKNSSENKVASPTTRKPYLIFSVSNLVSILSTYSLFPCEADHLRG
ncbi:hypothetical protein CMEL01_16584 [Colletotrichum melonis]|uniref:Uncharacterized protein n=1 Tax=Colletotrichum melonis TaxID=1209925 RepID=A0AAI9UA78_9PEZI|nr:hypothetical protein CMEL01_16584 [Colletotrichum melonis]